jgi:hypothetical protein
MNLDELGLAHGTDKASNIHDFLRLYERRLMHLRDESFLLIEIGVYHGGSMNTWSEYFPNATIVGLDTNEECRKYEHGNISVRIGNATDPKFLLDIIHEFGRPLVVLDDGSHRWDHQIQSLQILFPILRPSGFYVVEDLDTSFEAHLAQAPFQGLSQISGFDYLALLARRTVADQAFGSEKPHDTFIQENYKWVGSIEFARRTCVLSKKPDPDKGPC